jgi:RNA polymerase sigma-70 factor (ECF subfamily)
MLADEIPEGVEPVAPGAGAESELSTAQQRQRVRTALAALPDGQRRMIELSFWEGLSHSEVAEKTGVPLGTVKTRIRLGMLKLKESLGEVPHV